MTTPLPPDPRIARQQAMAAYLRVCLVVAFVLGALAVVLPDPAGRRFGVAMAFVLVLAPVGRLLWLLVRWLRRGDRRFAASAATLLVLLAVALVVSR